MDNRTGLGQLIRSRLSALHINQSEAARIAGRDAAGRPNLTRSTVSRLISRGLSPPLDPATIDGLAIALQVSRAEVKRAIVVTLGLGDALPVMSPEMADLILRVSDLNPEMQELWFDMAAASATVLSYRESGVRQPVHAATTTRRTGGAGQPKQRRDRGFAVDGEVSGDAPDMSEEDAARLAEVESAGRERWDEENGR